MGAQAVHFCIFCCCLSHVCLITSSHTYSHGMRMLLPSSWCLFACSPISRKWLGACSWTVRHHPKLSKCPLEWGAGGPREIQRSGRVDGERRQVSSERWDEPPSGVPRGNRAC